HDRAGDERHHGPHRPAREPAHQGRRLGGGPRRRVPRVRRGERRARPPAPDRPRPVPRREPARLHAGAPPRSGRPLLRLRDAPAEWVRRFEAAQVAAGPIYEFDEVFEDPQVKHLGLVTEIDQPGYGKAKMLAFPVRASATPATIRRPAPRLGEHTAEVLGELGLPKSEIDRLATAGVVALA